MAMTDQVLIQRQGALGHIMLNRAEALNALTGPMCAAITQALLAWQDDEGIEAVLIDGAGDRAFCAGGDVVMLHDSGKASDGRAEDFWRVEYALNELISRYPKPCIALIDGFVMGGGVGLSVHGEHRIAGDKTLFAMPETGIGYFPDVGGTYFLPRLGEDGDTSLGLWLGLSGARLKTAQAVAVGVATDYIPSDQHSAFTQVLASELGAGDGTATLLRVMDKFVIDAPAGEPLPSGLAAFREVDVPSILTALDVLGAKDNADADWAEKQAKIMRSKSPLALAVTDRAIRVGENLNFREAMAAELDLSLNFLSTQDFYEGIRAQLIDKDRNPQWSGEDVADISKNQVERLFRKTAMPTLEFLA